LQSAGLFTSRRASEELDEASGLGRFGGGDCCVGVHGNGRGRREGGEEASPRRRGRAADHAPQVRAEPGARLRRRAIPGEHLRGNASAQLFANLGLGISFGVTDDFTVRAQVLPLQLAAPAAFGGFRYGQESSLLGVDNLGPSIGATLRVVSGKVVEVGASLDGGIVTLAGLSGGTVTPGVPVRVHIGESLRLDTGAYLPVTLLRQSGPEAPAGLQAAAGLNVPVSLLYDITEPLHVGVGTGFQILDFSQPGQTVTIPVGVFAGYAIAGKDGPILDIDPFFTWPLLLTPGAQSAAQANIYTVGLSVGGFFYL
jgi:hypothetical protein